MKTLGKITTGLLVAMAVGAVVVTAAVPPGHQALFPDPLDVSPPTR